MSSADTQPTLPIPEDAVHAAAPAGAPRRRRGWIAWIIGFAIVVVLAVVAWFAGEAIARELVTKTVREQVVTRLSLPADHQIDVEVAGAVLPQLIGGTIGEITVSSDDVPLKGLTGDVTVVAHDVPVRGDAPIGQASATVTVDEEELRTLMASVDGFPAETLTLDEPDVAFTTELSFFGVQVPVAVSLTPTAADGDLVLSPAAIEVAGAEITADRLREQFGVVADVVLKDWTVCLAEYLPAAITVTGVEVVGEQLVADLDVDGAIVSDPALQASGTCV